MLITETSISIRRSETRAAVRTRPFLAMVRVMMMMMMMMMMMVVVVVMTKMTMMMRRG